MTAAINGYPGARHTTRVFVLAGRIALVRRQFADRRPAANDGAEVLVQACDAEREEPETAGLEAPWSDLARVAASIGARRDWRVEGAIEGPALAVLAAGEKVGKSWAAIDLALAVATGGRWLGRFPAVGVGPVLYLDGEYGEHEFARRLVRLARGANADVARALRNVRHLYSPAVTLQKTDDAYKAVLADAQRIQPALVIVDPFRNHLAGDENSARDVLVAFEALRGLRDVLGCPVLALHHLNKSGNASGSRALCGRADLLFEGSDGETPTFTVRGRLVRAVDPLAAPFTIEIVHEHDGDDAKARTTITCASSAAEPAKPTTLGGKIVAALQKVAPEVKSTNWLREVVGRSAADIAGLLDSEDRPAEIEPAQGTYNRRPFKGWRYVGATGWTEDEPLDWGSGHPDDHPDAIPTPTPSRRHPDEK